MLKFGLYLDFINLSSEKIKPLEKSRGFLYF